MRETYFDEKGQEKTRNGFEEIWSTDAKNDKEYTKQSDSLYTAVVNKATLYCEACACVRSDGGTITENNLLAFAERDTCQ